jgi:hypothetical protein
VRKGAGVTGCAVTPLTLETAPPLLALALGKAGEPEFVSGTRNLYRRALTLRPVEESFLFGIIQERENCRMYAGCGVCGFELRIFRDEAVKLKLDISGKTAPEPYQSEEKPELKEGERFKEDGVRYSVNGTERTDIYGLGLRVTKEAGTKTEVRIHRILRPDGELPAVIENLTLAARLFRDRYEAREYGRFGLRLERLLLMADETAIDAPGTVIGLLRYYCSGGLSAEVVEEMKNEKSRMGNRI